MEVEVVGYEGSHFSRRCLRLKAGTWSWGRWKRDGKCEAFLVRRKLGIRGGMEPWRGEGHYKETLGSGRWGALHKAPWRIGERGTKHSMWHEGRCRATCREPLKEWHGRMAPRDLVGGMKQCEEPQGCAVYWPAQAT